MISRPLDQTLLDESSTGAAAARESACIVLLSEVPGLTECPGAAERLGAKLNNTQDVERMDPEWWGSGVIIMSFGNAKGSIVDGRLVLRNQLSGFSIA